MPTLELDVSFAIPDDADALNEVMADGNKVAEILARNGSDGWTKFHNAVALASRKKDRLATDEQIAAQVQDTFAKLMEDNGFTASGRLPVTAANIDAAFAQERRRSNPLYRADSIGAKLDPHFSSYGQFIQAVWAESMPQPSAGLPTDTRRDLASRMDAARKITAAYSSHRGADGGYLIPESFRAEMMKLSLERALVRGRATVIPMSSPRVQIPAMNDSDRSGALFGGVTISWTEEENPATASSAKFRVITLDPDTMTGYTSIPNETLMDATATGAFFQASFPLAMAFEEDYAFTQGNGTGQPLGWLHAPCLVEVEKRDAAQPAETIVVENINDMYSRMLPTSLNSAVWVCNQEALPQILEMGLVVGVGGAPVMTANIAQAPQMTIYGRPLIVSEKVNPLGEAGDLSFVDLSFYLIGDREGMTVSSSTDYVFPDRKTAFLIVERVDGQPWLQTAVTPRKGTKTLSPFVTTEARSS